MKVFAGVDSDATADASYRNLVWDNLPDFQYTPAIVSINQLVLRH